MRPDNRRADEVVILACCLLLDVSLLERTVLGTHAATTMTGIGRRDKVLPSFISEVAARDRLLRLTMQRLSKTSPSSTFYSALLLPCIVSLEIAFAKPFLVVFS